MRSPIYQPVFDALARADVRYVVVGGVAVVLHGHPRMTADLDIAVDLAPEAATQSIAALTDLGLRPRVPVDASDFADPVARDRWVSEKGMTVLSLWDPTTPLRSVDVFVENPIPFDQLWDRSKVFEVESFSVRVASIDDLVRMKESAGRPIDLEDIEALREIERSKGSHE